MNLPLEHPVSDATGYRIGNGDGNTGATDPDRTFVVLAASGGGVRAAAFTYGVMKAMQQAEIGANRTLLDELDLVTSVSGGSFPAAYYGLFPEDFFARFPEEVLYRPIATELSLRAAAPWNLVRLLSPGFSRSDLAAEYYGDAIFRNRTFADMPRGRPWIAINGTDLSSGSPFQFTQNQFDVLCSDVDSVPVARAVAASAAVPVGFTPLTFRNYPKSTCGYTTPGWMADAASDPEDAPRRRALAKTWRRYEDAATSPYLHVSDGALSDNIGLRGFLDLVETGDPVAIQQKLNRGETGQVVVIMVDALANVEFAPARRPRPPDATTVLEAAVIAPLQSYSAEMVARLRTWFGQWEKAASEYSAIRSRCDALGPRAAQCRRDMAVTDADLPRRPELYVIEVRLDAIPDEDVRRQLSSRKTVVKLERREVDLLVEWAGKLMRASTAYQKLVKDGAAEH